MYFMLYLILSDYRKNQVEIGGLEMKNLLEKSKLTRVGAGEPP